MRPVRGSNRCNLDETEQIKLLEAEAQSNATTCNVAFAIGGAAALGGVVLVLTAPSNPSATGIDLAPWPGGNSAGANVGGRF